MTRTGFGLLVVSLVVSCSGKSLPVGSNDPASSQLVATLSEPEQAALCDSLPSSVTCSELVGSPTFWLWNQEGECINALAMLATTCQATVGQFTACVQADLSCADLSTQFAEPQACKALNGCVSGDSGSPSWPWFD